MSNIREGEATASQGSNEGCAGVAPNDHVRSLVQIVAEDGRTDADGVSGGRMSGGGTGEEASKGALGEPAAPGPELPGMVEPKEAPSARPQLPADWDQRVGWFDRASVFHSAAWARVLLDTYGWRPYYLEAAEGILPIIEARSWARTARGISLPFSDACEPLLRAPKDFAALLEKALALGRERKWSYLEIRGVSDKAGLQASSQFWTHELDLTGSPATVARRLRPRASQAIDRAHKLGVKVVLSSELQDLQAFWKLHQQTRRRHGVPPQPIRFMENLYGHMLKQGMGIVALASLSGRPVAGCVFLHFGTTAVYKLAASDHAMQQARGANAALWAGIEHYSAKGFQRLDMGRSDMDNDGLRQFKLGWGARESLLNYSKYDFKQNRFVADPPHSGPGIATRAFRCMPESVLQLMGNVLYRHAA